MQVTPRVNHLLGGLIVALELNGYRILFVMRSSLRSSHLVQCSQTSIAALVWHGSHAWFLLVVGSLVHFKSLGRLAASISFGDLGL